MADYGTPENPYIISIPGWDDIIKVHPRLKFWKNVEVAKSDWALFYRLRAQGRLVEYPDKDILGEIERKWKRIADLKASPTPEIVKSIGKIMTMIDNTEDLLSTGLVIGRAVAKKLPWLAARAGNRVTNTAGILLTARDVMEVATAFWKLLPIGRRAKKKGWDVLSPLNWGKKARLKRVSRFMAGKPGIPALIEGAQATDTLFGTGLQLGGLVGMVQDGVFGAVKAAQGKTVKINRDPEVSELPDLDRVEFGFAGVFEFVVGFKWPFQDTHMVAITAMNLGMQVIHNKINEDEIIARADEAAGFMMPHHMPWEPMTRLVLEDHGIDPDRDEPFLLPGSPYEVSMAEMAQEGINYGMDIMTNYVDMFPGGEQEVFMATHISELAEWPYNADLPPDQWEDNRPKRENSAVEALFSETMEKGIRPPIEEEYTPVAERTIHCGMVERSAELPDGEINPAGGSYYAELEALANDYKKVQEATGKALLGYENLHNLITCHFGKIMPDDQIPTEPPEGL